jgi:single-stranded-DNA-specific exonuclease
LDPDAYSPCSAEALPGLPTAADRLHDAVRRREAICVWGDFDVDGQTATTILVQTLRDLGAEVRFHIPVRETESHGVNLPNLARLISDGARLILTCDTGIAAHEAVTFARSKGVDMIITDHHELPPILPDALAVVNPKLLLQGESSGWESLRTLPGAGVAYKLAEALYARFGRAGEEARLTDLAALGIVADVAEQVGEARALVQRGVQTLRRTERLGLRALMESAELNPAWLDETHIAFAIAPRLNALGRLADANLSVELLTTPDLGRGRVLAATLEGLNAKRQLLTSQVFQAAQAQIQDDPSVLDDPVLVLSHPAWPAGVIGIVASRLVERYHRPVILLASPPGQPARGSARSVEGINITEAITAQRDLLLGFGGHPMAAGMSLAAENIPAFRRGLARALAGKTLPEESLQVDGFLALSDLSLELVEDLGRLAPFGAGNPPLILAAHNLSLKSQAAIGRSGEHLQWIVEDEAGNTRKVLWWQGAGFPLPQGRFDLAFSAHASDFRGQRDVTLEWMGFRPLTPPAEIVSLSSRIEVTDLRGCSHPLERLKALPDVQLWAEGEAKSLLAAAGLAPHTRSQLKPAPRLAIWTPPPGPRELAAALGAAAPQKLFLLGVASDAPDAEMFLKRLAGLVKFALRQKNGETTLGDLAAATAQSERAVCLGLDWLSARGVWRIERFDAGAVRFSAGGPADDLAAQVALGYLQAALAETAAFREYFGRAPAEFLAHPPE